MPWVAAVGTVVGSAISSQGAKDAANTQARAGESAQQTQERMLASQQALNEPYRAAGLTALDRLIQGTAKGGEFATPFKMEESEAQQFATKEAFAKMQSQMQVGGQGLSSNAIAGAGKLAGNIGSQYEAQAYNQWLTSRQQEMAPLQNIATMGQAAVSGQAANIGQAGSNISNLQTGIGNVQAAGQVGSANAIAGGFSSVSQYMMLQNLLGKQQTTTNEPLPAGGMTSTGTTPPGDYWK
jgi:hypothetical protein